MLTAREWLRRQRRRDDPIGDMARELALDVAAPMKNFSLFAYLMRHRPRETREAAREYLAARAPLTVPTKPPARQSAAPAERKKYGC